MSEPQAEKIYYKIYNKVVNDFGHNGMTRTNELNDFGDRMWGGKFLGSFPQDKLPEKIYSNPVKYAIINVDTTGMKGSHWVAVSGIPDSKKIMVFDSFGRASKNLLPVLQKQAGGNIIDTDRDAEQKLIQDSCGQYSLAWLLFRDKYGLDNARKI